MGRAPEGKKKINNATSHWPSLTRAANYGDKTHTKKRYFYGLAAQKWVLCHDWVEGSLASLLEGDPPPHPFLTTLATETHLLSSSYPEFDVNKHKIMK